MFQILVVEDNKNMLKLMKAVLKHPGYDVFTAENGLEALEITDKQHIDLIVLDIMMPEMNGYEFTEHLRNCGDNTPILMVTSKDLPEDIDRIIIKISDQGKGISPEKKHISLINSIREISLILQKVTVSVLLL